jgi:hypothetical protein
MHCKLVTPRAPWKPYLDELPQNPDAEISAKKNLTIGWKLDE